VRVTGPYLTGETAPHINSSRDKSRQTSKSSTGVAGLGLLTLSLATVSIYGQSVNLQSTEKASLILVNGKIITGDLADSIAEAVAIRDGKILSLGPKAKVLRDAGRTTRILDLRGLTVTPGLIDSHLHFAFVNRLYAVDLTRVASIDEALQALRAGIAKVKPGEWVRGEGWDEGKLAEHRYLFASDLDKVSPQNAVWLEHTSGHYGVANSVALRLAHITAETKDPEAGTIDRDAQGQPTGVLKEPSAQSLVTDQIPHYSREQLRNGYLTMMRNLNREGITAIKDPAIAEENWLVYQELLEEKKLTIHLFVLCSAVTSLRKPSKSLLAFLACPSRNRWVRMPC